METGSTIFSLLPIDAQMRLRKAARASGRRELFRIAYVYVQTIEQADEITDILLGAESGFLVSEAVQTADIGFSSRVSQYQS